MVIMALRTFETADAKYYLGLGNHETSSAPIFEDVDLGSLDFMVLESCYLSSPLKLINHPQYYELTKRYRDENRSATMYAVDYAPPRIIKGCEMYVTGVSAFAGILSAVLGIQEITQENFLGGLESLTGGAVLASEIELGLLLGGKNPSVAITLNNIKQNCMPTPTFGFRDAVAAKKTGEYLVPKHQHQDGSKVQVGILYGAMHSGIETKLKHPWISNATIKLYHDLFRYGDTAALNEVREIVPGQDDFVKYDCGLFK